MKIEIKGPVSAVPDREGDVFLVDSSGATVAVFFPCGDEALSAFDHARLCAHLINQHLKSHA